MDVEKAREVKIPMESNDPTGDVEKLTVQTGDRVKIPDEWLEHIGLEAGDDVGLVCKEDGIVVMEFELDKLNKAKEW